jgi:REP element-mobilizing transposase RayT
MADTYTQLYVHIVFTVQNHISLISKKWEERLYQYITGIIRNHEHRLIAINGTSDHIHILMGLNPNQSLSIIMREIKSDSSRWINENRFVQGKFSWQAGYGAFSYSRSQISTVAKYIENQKIKDASQENFIY